MDRAILLKAASVGLACLGGLWSVWTPRFVDQHSPDRDRTQRVNSLIAYTLTSISMLLLAATAFV